MAKKTSKPQSLEDTLRGILEAENEAYETAGIDRHFAVAFPSRQTTPILGQLAVKLLAMSGGIIQVQFKKRDNK